jgi:hypothetical protein
LIGDQIYADDVSVCFAKTITATAEQLLGWSERIDFDTGTSHGYVLPGASAVEPGPERRTFLEAQNALSSEHIDGHLLFLGEFYAMYLMVWSDAIWPREGGKLSLAKPEDLFPKIFWEQSEPREAAETDRLRVLSFVADVPYVRRALANVATSMIFDDHEVTDDWNLHGTWSLRVRGSQVGRRLLRNGLLAYGVFQDWGNRPDYYADGPGRFLLDSLVLSLPSAEPPLVTTPDRCDGILDIDPVTELPPEDGIAETATARVSWDYVVTGPQHQVIVLDTRTWRRFPPLSANAGLISDGSIARQLDARRPPAGSGTLSFVVSSAPVFGIPVMEEGVQKVGPRLRENGPEAYDNEPWGGNRQTFEYFIAHLAQFGSVVLLSGDVHYAFSNHVAYFRDSEPAWSPGRIVQLCGSSLKNEEARTRGFGLLGHVAIPETLGWLGYARDLGTLKDELQRHVKIHAFTTLPEIVRLLYRDMLIADRVQRPAVLPSGPWFDDVGFNLVVALGPPDWLYAIVYARDRRTTAQRVEAVPAVAEAVEWKPLDRISIGELQRAVVGANNISEVAVESSGGVSTAIHRIRWWSPPFNSGLNKTVMFTEHRLPLSPPVAAERPTPFRGPL